MTCRRALLPLLLTVAAFLSGCGGGMSRGEAQALGRAILDSPGVRKGLCVHVGSGNGRLTAELSRGGANTVLGLDTRPAVVDQARRFVTSQGLYGPVSVDRVPLDKLPLASNTANLVVADNFSQALAEGCSLREIARVLAPQGVVFLGKVTDEPGVRKALSEAGMQAVEAVAGRSGWLKAAKPVLPQCDDWSQFRHDASRAAISQDQIVGPTSGLHWIQGDLFGPGDGRAHTILASEGRIFYFIAKRGGKDFEHNAMLVVRDAFNGAMLWEKPIYLIRDTRLVAVAVNGLVYTHLTATGPVVALDAGTGTLVKTFALGGELTWHNGELLVHGQPAVWSVLDPQSGDVRRTFSVARPPSAYRGPIVIADSQAFLVEGGADAKTPSSAIVCFDYASAKTLWRVPNRGDGTLFCSHDGILVTKVLGPDRFTAPGVVRAYAARDGAFLWDYELIEKWGKMTSGIFLDGYYWTYYGAYADRGGKYVGIDPRTRALRMDNGPAKSSARCSEDMASPRYILSTDMGVVDKDMNLYTCHFARSACMSGYIAANGMFYQHEHQCVCGTYAHGVLGISCDPLPPLGELRARAPAPLEQGRAFGVVPMAGKTCVDEWPTYRHDALRSGASSAKLGARLHTVWTAAVGNEATSPVAAGDVVLAASGVEHSVVALDARSGKRRWRFTAGGRIDSPPTLYAGMALFGAHDGWVYCLRASDGRLVWRFRAAPEDRRIAVRGQVESTWPLMGAVLVDSGIAYVSAGRHSDADGGLSVYALQPATGAVVWQKVVQGMPPFRTDPNGASLSKATELLGARGYTGVFDVATLNDVLVSDGKTVFLGGLGVNPRSGETSIAPPGTALFGGPGTFLFDNVTSTNPGRANWSLEGSALGDELRMPSTRTPMRGACMSVDGSRVFGVWPGERKLELFAADYTQSTNSATSQWVRPFDKQTVRIEALLVAGDRIFVGCAPEKADSSGVRNGVWQVTAFAKEDGREVARVNASSGRGPRFDGMATAHGRLFVSTLDGTVVCLAE
jgi:outer membrane protein assembly factor BamB/ubiquinone/menaquinone biosynthesis C-methylase UbiE